VIGAVAGGSREATAKGAAIGAVGGAIAGNIWSKKMQRQREQMEAATAGTGVQVSQTADNRLKLEIPSDISFDTNRYEIKPDFRAVLDQFATSLQENPGTRVTIIGHTDSTGSDAVNNPLSVNRAASTRDYLSARGVSMTRISIDGRGSREPIAANDTPANRARNRRVEIFVAEPDTGGT
jgi:outer membrane protein OmpA-like peptidoglycan-associated protein